MMLGKGIYNQKSKKIHRVSASGLDQYHKE